MNNDKPSAQLFDALKDLSNALTVLSITFEQYETPQDFNAEEYEVVKEYMVKALQAFNHLRQIIYFILNG